MNQKYLTNVNLLFLRILACQKSIFSISVVGKLDSEMQSRLYTTVTIKKQRCSKRHTKQCDTKMQQYTFFCVNNHKIKENSVVQSVTQNNVTQRCNNIP